MGGGITATPTPRLTHSKEDGGLAETIALFGPPPFSLSSSTKSHLKLFCNRHPTPPHPEFRDPTSAPTNQRGWEKPSSLLGPGVGQSSLGMLYLKVREWGVGCAESPGLRGC